MTFPNFNNGIQAGSMDQLMQALGSYGQVSQGLGEMNNSPIANGGLPGPAVPGPANGGLGANLGTLQLGLGGIQTLAGLWGAFQANKLAKDQHKFTKNVTNTNLANQIKSYNTALTDRANTRAVMEGRDPSTAQAYIEQNQLRR